VLVLRDELVGWMAQLDKQGQETARPFYLEAWNGKDTHGVDRIGRGSTDITNFCVSVFGGIQPDKLTAYLEQTAESLANDGLLQRFQLLVYPDRKPWRWCDRVPNSKAREVVFRLFNKLADLDPIEYGAAPADELCKFPYFRFSNEAQATFIDWSTKLHAEKVEHEEHPIIA